MELAVELHLHHLLELLDGAVGLDGERGDLLLVVHLHHDISCKVITQTETETGKDKTETKTETGKDKSETHATPIRFRDDGTVFGSVVGFVAKTDKQ